MELKMQAARERKSIAAIVREKVSKKRVKGKKSVEAIMKEVDKLAKETARQCPGLNLTEKLIEMRYEQ